MSPREAKQLLEVKSPLETKPLLVSRVAPDLVTDRVWAIPNATIALDSPVIMGILNVTPDSFSDGGAYGSHDEAITTGLRMVDAGATIIDVGGESTRPGAESVSIAEEAERVVSIIEALASSGVTVSVDTSKSEVAWAAIRAGAAIVNDVTGLEDPAMRDLCAAEGVGVVVMHMQGEPRTMQHNPQYDDVVDDILRYLVRQADRAIDAGVDPNAIAIDPGIGFGKSFEDNIELMENLDAFVRTGYPVLLGTSRKRFLGTVLEPLRGKTEPAERDIATAATVALAVAAGVRILRVHNVALAVEVAHTAKAMVPERWQRNRQALNQEDFAG